MLFGGKRGLYKKCGMGLNVAWIAIKPFNLCGCHDKRDGEMHQKKNNFSNLQLTLD